MPHKRIIAIFLLIQIIGSNSLYLDINAEISEEPCQILFIGSSYFNWYNLPELFENLTDNAEKDVFIDKYCVNGLYLSDHASRSTTENKINQTDWDYVILQGVGITTAYPEEKPDKTLLPSLITIRDKIISNCNSTKMVFCLPWAFEDGYGWNDTYGSMQIEINEKTLNYSKDVNFTIAPVGWAWNTVLRDKNFPQHYLHHGDGNHPNRKGTYLMACVIFSTIFQEKSTSISFYSDLTRFNAKYFQNVASHTVLDNLNLWNLDPLPPNENTSISGFNFSSILLFTLIGLSVIILIQKKTLS